MSDYLYSQVHLPVFQNVTYASRAEALRAVLGDVELVQDERSGLVFNRRFDPNLLDYDIRYENEQSYSELFREHLRVVLALVQRHHARGTSVVEIGSGKGFFFEMLQAAGIDAIGYDPAYAGDNPRIRKAYFSDSSVGDFIVLRHVLEHIPRPLEYLVELSTRAKAGTRILIEVPCFDWIMSNRAFYDIFYEHCNYFTLDVLSSWFKVLYDSGHFFGGQYFYVIADLSSLRIPRSFRGRKIERLEFASAFENCAAGIRRKKTPPFIWGAGAKGMTFSNKLDQRGIIVEGLIDINPAKQDRYVGLSGLKIFSPYAALPFLIGRDVYVMNPNYLSEIQLLLAFHGLGDRVAVHSIT
jgi:hypothetical protein